MFAKDKKPPVDPDVRLCHVLKTCNHVAVFEGDAVERVAFWPDAEEAGGLAPFLECRDHLRERGIGKSVSVRCEEDLVITDQSLGGSQPFADRRLESCVQKGDVPIVDITVQELYLPTSRRKAEVICQRFAVIRA